MGQDWNKHKKHDRLNKAFAERQEREFVVPGVRPTLELSEFEVAPDVLAMVPKEVIMKYTLIPVNRAGATLVVAVAHDCPLAVINDLEFLTGYRIELVYAREDQIRAAIEKI